MMNKTNMLYIPINAIRRPYIYPFSAYFASGKYSTNTKETFLIHSADDSTGRPHADSPYLKDKRIIHNSLIHQMSGGIEQYLRKTMVKKIHSLEKELNYVRSMPLCIERSAQTENIGKVSNDTIITRRKRRKSVSLADRKAKSFPLAEFSEPIDARNLSEYFNESKEQDIVSQKEVTNMRKESIEDDILYRLKAYNDKNIEPFLSYQKNFKNFKLSDPPFEDPNSDDSSTITFYGSSDSKLPSSSIPCGGCGAFLHCQSEGLPGYIPSESFIGKRNRELQSLICQRCYFLKNHNIALNVRVAPEEYEKALFPLAKNDALAIVVLDLMDTPCSVWPGLHQLLGDNRPVIVVGNKIDLLPPDGPNYLPTIEESFANACMNTSLSKINVQHIALVSAKTGFGIEQLITNIQSINHNSGDVYIIGCTNVGKSSLFNALLGSDLCASSAANLVQRATASYWPGTTLNLLKFPLLKLSGKYLDQRTQRLTNKHNRMKELELRDYVSYTKSAKVATLTDTIERTVMKKSTILDPFASDSKMPTLGIDEKDERFSGSHWCFDTPGTVQPDQLLCLLTHEELVKVIPKETLEPQTYIMRTGESLFIGGLSRIDVLFSATFARFTVFSSSELPITIVKTPDASSIYRSYIGSPLLAVPFGSEERLKNWPALKPVNINVFGCGYKSAAADVVLSSSGFISISAEDEIDLRCWTPGGRGIYLRDPPMLPLAVTLRGKKDLKCRLYKPHSFYVPH